MKNLKLHCQYCNCTEVTSAGLEPVPACAHCLMPVSDEAAARAFKRCYICERLIILNSCGCGGVAERLCLTIQRAMRYLDIQSLTLDAAAKRYFAGDRTEEAAKGLRLALENWVEAREDLKNGKG